MNLATSRGASEAVRVRTLREGVAQIKQALEIAMTQTKDKHAVEEERQGERRRDDADAARNPLSGKRLLPRRLG